MSTQTIIVSQVEPQHGRTAKGRAWTRYVLHTADGKSYGMGFNPPPPDLQPGAKAEINVVINERGYEDAVVVSVKPSAPDAKPPVSGNSSPTGGSAGGASGRRYRQNGEAGGFPVHPLAYERTLDRRNALNVAVAFISAKASLYEHLTKAEGAAILKMDAEGVIELASLFEAYTCGDRERAEMKLRAEKRKKEEEEARAKAEAAAKAAAEAAATAAAGAEDGDEGVTEEEYADDDMPF